MQRRVARFVKNECSATTGTVTKILNDLKWPLEKESDTISGFVCEHKWKTINHDGLGL